MFRIRDNTGQLHHQRIALQDTADWQEVKIRRFDAGEEYRHTGGADDGTYHSPAEYIALNLDRSHFVQGKLSGELWIDDVRAGVTPSDLSVEQQALGNIFLEHEPVRFAVESAGDSIAWEVYDYWNNKVLEGNHVMAGGQLDLVLPINQYGYFKLNLAAEKDGQLLKEYRTSFAVLSDEDFSQVNDSPFAIQTHFGQSHGDPATSPLLEKLGIRTIRDEQFWERLETAPGVYDFTILNSKFERYVEALHQQQIEPYLLFGYTNPFHDQNSTPYSDAGRQAFARFAQAVVAHYEDEVQHVGVYNEFNARNFGDRGDGPADSLPQYYYQLLVEVYEAVKEARPGVKVVGGDFAAGGGAGGADHALAWFEEVLKLGGLQFMDIVAVHPYRYNLSGDNTTPESLQGFAESLDSLIREYNDGQSKPIWFTELGWPTYLAQDGIDEYTQAAYLVRSAIVSLASGVEKFFWYDFTDDGLDAANHNHNFGVVHYKDDPAGAYTPKPSYAAYAALIRQLTGTVYVDTEELDATEKVLSHRFSQGQDEIRVIWAPKGSTDITILTDESVEVTDMMGNTQLVEPHQGQIFLTAGEDPLYVRGHIERLLPIGKFSVNGSRAVIGEDIRLTIHADNKTPGIRRGPVHAAVEVLGNQFEVTARPGEQISQEVVVPNASRSEGTNGLFAKLYFNGKLSGLLRTSIDHVHPLSIVEVTPYILDVELQELKMRVTVQNNSHINSYDLSDLSWRIGEEEGLLQEDQILAPNSTASVDVALPPLSYYDMHALSISTQREGKTSVIHEGRIEFNPVMRHGSSDKPHIDLMTQGRQDMNLPYQGAQDLSGTIALSWDDDHLYVEATVIDDVYDQADSKGNMWRGDSIQFAVAEGLPGSSESWYEFGMALTPEGPELFRWRSTVSTDVPALVDHAALLVERIENEKATVYELALPWTELVGIDPHQDRTFSFSILVNDNDGGGRKGWIEWGAGIGRSKDSGLFRAMQLLTE